MKTKRVGWLLIFLSYVGVVLAQNLDDQERRWAISGSWGGNWPIVTKNTLSGKAVSAGHIHTLMLEYYIPYTRFSLKGGYTGEYQVFTTLVLCGLHGTFIMSLLCPK